MRTYISLCLFFSYLSVFLGQNWEPCFLSTSTPGMDIADNATQFPNPFLWFTNTSHPGVTLPGPYIQNMCGWAATGTAFQWTTSQNTCFLNGQGYPLSGSPRCINQKYATNASDFQRIVTKFMYAVTNLAKPVVNSDRSTAYVASFSINGTAYQAAMSIGHGMLSGLCGNCFLIRNAGQYVLQLQTDVRAWSLELSGGANVWLASNNYGGTCYIPDVLQISCDDALNSETT